MKHIKRPTGYLTKLATVLHYLTFDGSLNRFEAERIGDHCLHSTVSVLRNDYGLSILDEFESVPCLTGKLTEVKRYWIEHSSKPNARKLLKAWRIKKQEVRHG